MESNSTRYATDYKSPKVKIYGGQAALCAEAICINKNGQPVYTINLEIAPKVSEQVHWQRKILIQLSQSELPNVCSVLLGYQNEVHLKRPGKGIELIRQPENLYIRGSQGIGNLFALPASSGDVFRLSAFLLQQLKKQCGLESETMMLAALRASFFISQGVGHRLSIFISDLFYA